MFVTSLIKQNKLFSAHIELFHSCSLFKWLVFWLRLLAFYLGFCTISLPFLAFDAASFLSYLSTALAPNLDSFFLINFIFQGDFPLAHHSLWKRFSYFFTNRFHFRSAFVCVFNHFNRFHFLFIFKWCAADCLTLSNSIICRSRSFSLSPSVLLLRSKCTLHIVY